MAAHEKRSAFRPGAGLDVSGLDAESGFGAGTGTEGSPASRQDNLQCRPASAVDGIEGMVSSRFT